MLSAYGSLDLSSMRMSKSIVRSTFLKTYSVVCSFNRHTKSHGPCPIYYWNLWPRNSINCVLFHWQNTIVCNWGRDASMWLNLLSFDDISSSRPNLDWPVTCPGYLVKRIGYSLVGQARPIASFCIVYGLSCLLISGWFTVLLWGGLHWSNDLLAEWMQNWNWSECTLYADNIIGVSSMVIANLR